MPQDVWDTHAHFPGSDAHYLEQQARRAQRNEAHSAWTAEKATLAQYKRELKPLLESEKWLDKERVRAIENHDRARENWAIEELESLIEAIRPGEEG